LAVVVVVVVVRRKSEGAEGKGVVNSDY